MAVFHNTKDGILQCKTRRFATASDTLPQPPANQEVRKNITIEHSLTTLQHPTGHETRRKQRQAYGLAVKRNDKFPAAEASRTLQTSPT